jgi:hypothetical protein
MFLATMAIAVLVTGPQTAGLGVLVGHVNQQDQTAKSLLYLAAFVVILPAALQLVPRLADAIARGPNGAALSVLGAVLVGSLAALLIAVRISHRLPWGDGLTVMLLAVLIWGLGAGAALIRAVRGGSWPALLKLRGAATTAWLTAGVLVFAALLCVTSTASLHAAVLAAGALIGLGVLVASLRLRLPSRLRVGRAIDVVVIIVFALAIPNLVIFKTSGALPNIYVPPGVIQNQQDYLLGSANQLLGGGALLVNVPVSQYGVGLVYFLDGWFHLAPIGYGTLGFLDGVLTALLFMLAYVVLLLAEVRRSLAVVAMAVAVVTLIYGLVYGVGALPETGPLRFGLPMLLVAAKVCQMRLPGRRAFEIAAFVVIGVSAVWAFEAFAYTVVVFAAVLAVQVWLRRGGQRRQWLVRQIVAAVAACLAAHLLLAGITLAIIGQLPDWGQYLTYVRSFLLGGEAGAISYGFARWSAGLAVGAGALASAAALVLLLRRLPGVVRQEPVTTVAIAGTTAYAIALLSYTDNRSSTYLLLYVTLPLLMAATLWLALLLRRPECTPTVRSGGLAFAIAVSVLLISSSWSLIGRNFSQSALAHAYPGGGLRAAVHRLWHPPPIDPRAPEGVRLLDRYIPGDRALIVLPVDADLGVEILMRSERTNLMFIGDPVDDSLVPSLWLDKLTADVARLRTGQHLLIDRSTLTVLAQLLAHPGIDPEAHAIDAGAKELEWLLKEIARRFEIRPISQAADGLIIAKLAPRG